MAERRPARFNCQPLEELTRQLLYAPVDRRQECVFRAERLHDSLEPEGLYPQDYIAYRITGIPAVESSENQLVGEAVLPDIRLVIDELSRSLEIPFEPEKEQLWSARDLAERLGVSTKTITRWRKLGLRWRHVTNSHSGRREVRYSEDSVTCFLARHGDRVERAASFTQMDSETREAVLRQARELAETEGLSLFKTAQRMAEETGRAVETLRLLFERHDARHPDDRIFEDHTRPLDSAQKKEIVEAIQSGARVPELARRYRRARVTIYRALREGRAANLRRRVVKGVSSPLFDRDDADEVLLRAEDDDGLVRQPRLVRVNELPQPLRRLYLQRPLESEREHDLFVRLNYLKYKFVKDRANLDPHDPRVAALDRLEGYLNQIDTIRSRLVRANLGHVLTVVHGHLVGRPASQRGLGMLVELLRVGQQFLIEQVDQFDPWGKQSSFVKELKWKLMRHFATTAPQDWDESRAAKRLDGDAVLEQMMRDAELLGIVLFGQGSMNAEG